MLNEFLKAWVTAPDIFEYPLTQKEKDAANAYLKLEELINQGWEFPNAHTQVVIDFNLNERGANFIKALYDAASNLGEE